MTFSGFTSKIAGQPGYEEIQIAENLHVVLRQFTPQYGYPVDDITYITEDHHGHLWMIGSETNGMVFQRKGYTTRQLWRFDGTEFINFGTPDLPVFGTSDSHKTGEKGVEIRAVNYWADDSLLISKWNMDFYYFDIGDQAYHQLFHPEVTGEFVAGCLHDGVLFLATSDDTLVDIWKVSDGQFDHLAQIEKQPGEISFFTDGSDIWVSFFANGVYRYTSRGKLIRKYGLEDFTVTQIREHSTDASFLEMQQARESLIISSRLLLPGIQRYDSGSDQFRAIDGIDSLITSGVVFHDTPGNIMYLMGIPLQRSYLRLEDPSGQITILDTLLNIIPGMAKCYGKDLTRHFWVAATDGLHLVKFMDLASNTYLSGVSCRAITRADSMGILVGTENNSSLYYVPLPFNHNKILEVGYNTSQANRVLLKDGEGYWTNNTNELVYLDAAFSVKRTFSLHLASPEAIVKLPDGSFLLGNDNGGLERLSPENRTSEILFEGRTGEPFHNRRIHVIQPLSNRKAIIGTDAGAWLLDLKSHSVQPIPQSAGESVLSMYAEQSSLFAGCFSGKLIAYSVHDENIQPDYVSETGTPIATITPDTSGNLWLGTFSGVLCYRPASKTLWRLTEVHLADAESNRHSAYFDTMTNSLCIGSVNGLSIIDLDKLGSTKETQQPYLLLNSVTYFNPDENQLHKYPLAAEEISLTLPAKQRFLSVGFHIDDLVASSQHIYKYRLSKGSGEWYNLGSSSELTLHYLDAGRYNIEIAGWDAKGTRSSNTARIQLHVRGFFYESVWFYLALVIIALLLIVTWMYNNIQARRRLELEVAARTQELRKDKETIEQQTQKLRHFDKLKSRFFANISHELRTPLTLILSPLKQARSKVKLNPELQGHLDLAITNARTMERQVEELLALSKLEHGLLRLNPTETELIQFLNTTASNFQSLMHTKNINYHFENQLAESWVTSLDRSKMQKILYNLIYNAIKFTQQGGAIDLIVSDNKDGVLITVADTGRGIPPEDIPHIFDRYFQTSRADAPAEGGTGIGLALVKELTVLHGGHIHVVSEEGKGSKFTLFFPFKQLSGKEHVVNQPPLTETVKAKPSTAANITPPTNNAARLLIVEDNPDLRSHIAQILQPHYTILQAQNGVEALEMLREQEIPDIILSDVMMPEMDGFELLKQVRKNNRTRFIPFCFLTAKAGIQDKISALRLGVDDYILKPFHEEELLARIENLLAHARKRKSFHAETDTDSHVPDLTDDLLLQVQQQALKNLDHPQFSIDFLAEKCKIPRRSLHRYILSETGMTPNRYIQELRLTKARSLLEKRVVKSVTEASTLVGFQKPKYFSKLFKERFGKSPSEYLR